MAPNGTVLPTSAAAMLPATPFGDARAAARALGAGLADAAVAITAAIGGAGGSGKASAAGGGGGNGGGTPHGGRASGGGGGQRNRGGTTTGPSIVSIVASAAAGAAAAAASQHAPNKPLHSSNSSSASKKPTPLPSSPSPSSSPLTPAERALAAKRVAREAAAAYASVLTWMSLSVLVIASNKWLLACSGFPFPLALTAWHMVACSAFGLLAVRGPFPALRLARPLDLSPRDYCRRVLPVGLLYAGSLWLSNSAYLSLSVSFIQMTKSLMPGLVYAFGCAAGTERPRASRAATMALIAGGVAVCALGEGRLSRVGLVQQLAALGFEALRLTMVQVLMSSGGGGKGRSGGSGSGSGSGNSGSGGNGARVGGGQSPSSSSSSSGPGPMNPLQSLYYVSPACLAFLAGPLLCVELPRYRALAAASAAAASAARSAGPAAAASAAARLAASAAAAPPLHISAPALLLNAAAALLLNLAVFGLVGRTSALTLNVAGVAKDWLLILVSWAAFGSPVSALTLGGYALCCGGVAVYNGQKLGEMRGRAAGEAVARRVGGLRASKD
jgi:hypothetical protein